MTPPYDLGPRTRHVGMIDVDIFAENWFVTAWAIDGVVYFSGLRGGLSRSDGTTAGTYRINDLQPFDVAKSGEFIYFEHNGIWRES